MMRVVQPDPYVVLTLGKVEIHLHPYVQGQLLIQIHKDNEYVLHFAAPLAELRHALDASEEALRQKVESIERGETQQVVALIVSQT